LGRLFPFEFLVKPLEAEFDKLLILGFKVGF